MKAGDKFRAYQKAGHTEDDVPNTIFLSVSRKKGDFYKEPMKIKMFPNLPADHAPFIMMSATNGNTIDAEDTNGIVRTFRPSMWRIEPV